MKLIDLTGQKFGRLNVLKRVESDKNRHARFLCRCDCGVEKIVAGDNLTKGRSRSCGCLSSELSTKRATKHGFSKTKIHNEWQNMIGRCYNKKRPDYDRYGGRGIKVCDKWRDDFQAFYDDVSKLPHFGESGYSLDRIDVDGDYTPENVRFANAKEQARNRRNTIKVEYNGEILSLPEAAEKSGVGYVALYARYKRGDRGEKLFRPVRKRLAAL